MQANPKEPVSFASGGDSTGGISSEITGFVLDGLFAAQRIALEARRLV